MNTLTQIYSTQQGGCVSRIRTRREMLSTGGSRQLAGWHLLATLVAAICGFGGLRASAQSLTFSQLDFSLDGADYFNTEWCRIDFEYSGPSTYEYLNVAINGTWQVQNEPVTGFNGVGIDQILSLYCGLNTPRGTVETSLTYDYAFTDTPMGTMPSGTLTAPVGHDLFAINGNVDSGTGQGAFAAAGPAVGGSVISDPALPHDHHKNFPNQHCGVNECVPAAVSDSLKYMNRVGKTAIPDNLTSIAATKTFTAWGAKGSPTATWWQTKGAWGLTNGISTRQFTLADMDKLDAELQDHQDVEIVYSWADGTNGGSHAMALVDIVKVNNGWTLYVADDTKQGTRGDDNSGCHTRILNVSNSGKVFAPGYGWRDFNYAIVECPEPGTVSLLGLALLVLIRRRKQASS